MEEYEVKCYVAKRNDTLVAFESNFSDLAAYNEWSKKTEEIALANYYNRKVTINPNEI